MQWKHNKIRCWDSLETILMQQIVNNEIGANFLLYRYKTFITVIVSIQLCLWVWVSKLSLSLFFFFVFTLPVFVFILSQWTVHLLLIGSTRSFLSSCFYVGTFHFLCTCLSCCYIQPVFRRFWPLCFCRYYCFGFFFFYPVLASAHFGSVTSIGLILGFDPWVIYDCEFFFFCLINDYAQPAPPVASAFGSNTCFLACLAQTLTFISGVKKTKQKTIGLRRAVSLSKSSVSPYHKLSQMKCCQAAASTSCPLESILILI